MIQVSEKYMKEEGIDPRNSKPTRRAWAVFKCPVCLQNIDMAVRRGSAAKKCANCRGYKHGHSGKKYYYVWQQLKDRCTNPSNVRYPRYGGRGIVYDTKWDTFEGFWEDMRESYQEGLTIDRIDNDGNYCKNNCAWITLEANSAKTCRTIR